MDRSITGLLAACVLLNELLMLVSGAVLGLDVSSHQPSVNWPSVRSNGASFAYIKATEGIRYRSPGFQEQHTGATNAGLITGAYHLGLPGESLAELQVLYFLAHGGGWSGDGHTLPGALDIEYNPYGATCYGLSQAEMIAWISEFVTTYRTLTTVYPVIYTTTDWFNTCVGSALPAAAAAQFSSCPLWIPRYSSSVGPLPPVWNNYTFWQYSTSGIFPGDQDVFNGDLAGLTKLARL